MTRRQFIPLLGLLGIAPKVRMEAKPVEAAPEIEIVANQSYYSCCFEYDGFVIMQGSWTSIFDPISIRSVEFQGWMPMEEVKALCHKMRDGSFA